MFVDAQNFELILLFLPHKGEWNKKKIFILLSFSVAHAQ